MDEVRRLIAAAHLPTPLVLVGLSLGACVARLFAAEYPAEVAGMVIVDHAFRPDPPDAAGPPPAGRPAILSQTPISVTTEDISNFQRLPERLRSLHRWAASLHPKLPTWEDAEDCLSQLKTAAPGPEPLGDLPLVVVSTANQSRGYARLQYELMSLSRRSRQMIAARSFHAVEIDQPEVVAAAIRKVVGSVRQPAGR